jgi:hypothetical protein
MRFFSVNEYGMDAPFRREERRDYEPRMEEAGTTKATAGTATAVARAAGGCPARSLIKGRL